MPHTSLATLIDAAFEKRAEFNAKNAPADVRDAVDKALMLLDNGAARVTEKIAAQVLTFRFGEPWNPLNQPVGSCAMMRMASPPVIVTGLAEADVSAALRENRCAVESYRVLTLSH